MSMSSDMMDREGLPLDEVYAASTSFTSERGTRKSRRKDELWIEISSHKDFMFTVLFTQHLIKDTVQCDSLAAEANGLSFIFTYAVVQILVSLPIMMSQFILGQYGHAAFIRVWAIAPIAYGIGYSMMILLMIQAIVSSAVFTTAFVISTYAFSEGLRWADCDSFKSDKAICIDRNHNITINNTCCTQDNQENCTVFPYEFSALHFWHKIIMPAHDELEDWHYFGALKLDVTIYNLILWTLIALAVATRMQTILKLVPVILKMWFACHGIILLLFLLQSGARLGFQQLFRLREQKFLSYSVWWKTFTHVVSSQQLGTGVLILLSSFLANEQVRYMDSCILSFFSVGLAFFFTFIYFSAYGIVSQAYKLPYTCFIVKDWGSLFGLMPEALYGLPVPEMWTLLYFIPICIVCCLQTALLLTTSINGLIDQFPILKHYKSYLAGLCCFICLILSLPLASQASFQILKMVESHLLYECIIIILILYIICVNLIYGVQRLLDDFHFMTFYSEPEFLHVLTHFTIFPVVILSCMSFPSLTSCDDIISEMCYTKYLLMVIVLGPIIVTAIVKYVEFAKQENLMALIKIASTWGPQEKSERNARLHFNPKKSLCYKDPLGNKCKHSCLVGDPSLKLLVYRFELEKERMLNPLEHQKKIKHN